MDIAPLSKWIPDLKHPLVIAGPCSAENSDQVMATAQEVAKIPAVRIFRAGIWKPRTRPNCFEGVGEVGLPWLREVKKYTNLLTSVEVANAKHVEQALKGGVDIFWIGARTSANPFSVQEIADALKGSGVPVMVKNPVNADLSLWIGALERIANAGINKLVAIHRGFSSFASTKYRNAPKWKIPMELKRRFPSLPIICDPSHIGGKRELIAPICQKAMDIDMEGLMIETHIDPSLALSDASQQVTPQLLGKILTNLSYRTEFSTDRTFETELEELREKIDRVDHDLIEGLQLRMQLVEKIGNAKVRNNVTALQVSRMDQLLQNRENIGQKLGLRSEYIREIYTSIHAESVKTQTDIMSKAQKK